MDLLMDECVARLMVVLIDDRLMDVLRDKFVDGWIDVLKDGCVDSLMDMDLLMD
jgi:hypothetical protein